MAYKIINLKEDATWGKHGADLLTSIEHRVYGVEGPFASDDESSVKFSYRSYTGKDENGNSTYENLYSTATVARVYQITVTDPDTNEVTVSETEADYAGEYNVKVKVTVTANEKLTAKFGNIARVYIDGKEYDLGVLKNPVEFITNKVHRIKISWAKGVVEVFRIKPSSL